MAWYGTAELAPGTVDRVGLARAEHGTMGEHGTMVTSSQTTWYHGRPLHREHGTMVDL